MGTNTGKGFRHGAVRGRAQFLRSDDNYQKRNELTGEFMEIKETAADPFKGVAKELDGRDTPNA